jgi:hypothetical protein
MATRRINRDTSDREERPSRTRSKSDYDEVDEEAEYEEAPRSRRRSRDDDDDDRDEKPRRSRARDDDDEEEDDRPARRRSHSRDDDEDEDEEKPTRRRRASRDDDDEDEDEKPRSRRRSRDDDDDDEDEKPRGRRRNRDDDDDEEEEPKAKRRAMKGGWKTADRAKDASGSWANEVKLSSEEVVYKFLDDEPFVVYGQHWIDERKGKKSFVCLADPDVKDKGKDCPLCAIGDKPRIFSAFNVLRIEADLDPALEVLTAATRLTEQLKDKGSGKSGPLTAHYWGLSRSGKGNSTSYSQIPIKERDLGEEWDVDPLSKRELEDFEAEAYTSKTFPENPPSLRDLKEIAAEIAE